MDRQKGRKKERREEGTVDKQEGTDRWNGKERDGRQEVRQLRKERREAGGR